MYSRCFHAHRNATHYVVLTVILVVQPFSAFAGRPFATEDAGVAGRGNIQIEVSWDHVRWQSADRENIFTIVPIMGILNCVELSIEAPLIQHFHFDGVRHSGFGDISINAKLLLAEETDLLPAVALRTTVRTPTGNSETDFSSGTTDYGVLAAASKTLWSVTLHGMLGYSFNGTNGYPNICNTLCWGIAAEAGLSERMYAVGEILGGTNPDRSRNEHVLSVLAGILFFLSDHVAIDASGRFGLTAAMPQWNSSIGIVLNL